MTSLLLAWLLVYEPPAATCPSHDEMSQRIAARTGGRLPPGDVVSISIAGDGGAFKAAIRVDDQPPRTFEGSNCREVAEAAAAILAVLTDDSAPRVVTPPPAPVETSPDGDGGVKVPKASETRSAWAIGATLGGLVVPERGTPASFVGVTVERRQHLGDSVYFDGLTALRMTHALYPSDDLPSPDVPMLVVDLGLGRAFGERVIAYAGASGQAAKSPYDPSIGVAFGPYLRTTVNITRTVFVEARLGVSTGLDRRTFERFEVEELLFDGGLGIGMELAP
jgi:hypothetical protein